jgi:hypothetical protein
LKAFWESGRITPLTFNLGTRWRYLVSFTSDPLYLQAESPVLIEYEAGWASESVWTVWSEEKSLPPAGYSADSLVTIPTTLSWLLIFYK